MMWHKCKNGTLVNLDQCTSIDIWSRESFHWHEGDVRGKWDCVLAANSESNSEAALCSGTREECEAELRAIEDRIKMHEEPIVFLRTGHDLS